MNISYDYYRVFYYVAKCRSFTRAAAVLLSNQPNVTRTIKTLETELGCILFVRSHQGVQLTPEGEKLFRHISIAFEQIEAGEAELALGKSLQGGTVSIGASEVALHYLLLPVLKKYQQLYPGIHIRVSTHSTPQAVSALKNGLVDLAVVTTPVSLPRRLKSTIITNFQEVAVCGSSFADLTGRKLSLAELTEKPLICLDEHTKTYEFYSNLFMKKGLTFSPIVEATTIDQILPLVRNNLGIGFVPELFLKNFSESDQVYRLQLKTPIPKRDICAVKRTGFALNMAARKLEEMILQAC